MNLSKTFLFASILAATMATAGVIDDAKFKLDLRGGASTFTQPGDLGNALDFSAASPLTGYMGDQRGPQTYNANFLTLPTQEVAAVTNPYYPYTTNTQSVLHFYQDFKGSDKGSVNSGIVIPGAAPQTSTQTFYVRFRWDGVAPAKTGGSATGVYLLQSGNSDNGNSANGVSLYLDSQSVSGSTTNIYISCRVGANGGKHFNLIKTSANQIKAGEWNDVFLTIAQEADNATYTATLSVCKTPSATDAGFNPPALNSISTNRTGVLTFDSTNLSLGLYHNSANVRDTTRCFRGLIADFMVWNRALTDNEKIEVMAGQHGAKWRVGAINGSADEFTDSDPAAVFEPQTMPWRQMRKTLDASHRTLTLKSPLATYEAGKPMILHIDPLFTDTPASVPVTVSVNGSAVGSFDLAEKRNFIIERGNWQRDGSGNVTVAITRTETTGSVAIDALSLSGSWQITEDDRASNGMLDQPYAASHAFAGDANDSHFTRALSVGASHTNYTFGVYVPTGMGEKCGWRFRTKTTTLGNTSGLDWEHTLLVNGVTVGAHSGMFGTYEYFNADIPAGTLHDGMNYVQWVQPTPTLSALRAQGGNSFQFYDFWAMDLIPPPNAFVITVR